MFVNYFTNIPPHLEKCNLYKNCSHWSFKQYNNTYPELPFILQDKTLNQRKLEMTRERLVLL